MKKTKGFTIIELLTVIAIITLLVGLLTPGVRKAKQIASNLKQRCQLYDIEVGLELWYSENDSSYPDSDVSGAALYTTGSHKLAEALMGRDSHGFDSKSSWDAETDEVDPTIYGSVAPYSDRNSVYIDSDKVDNFQIAQIYDVGATGIVYPGDIDATGAVTSNSQAGVLTDIFRNKRVTMPLTNESVKTGSPILYFKAKNTTIYNPASPNQSIFNYRDNWPIFALGHNVDGVGEEHPFANTDDIDANGVNDGIDDFYDTLINPRARINGIGDPVPYNKDTYILLSAGSDGLYGTSDDVTNISK